MSEFAVSERRACRLVGQNRSTQRYLREIPQDEPVILARMKELARAGIPSTDIAASGRFCAGRASR